MPATVLIVSQRSATRNKLRRVFDVLEPGATVAFYQDPFEALVWATYRTPDITLIDCDIPDMDCNDFVERLRKIPEMGDAPVSLMVSQDRPGLCMTATNKYTDVMPYPLRFQDCKARINLLLSLRRQQRIIIQQARWLQNSAKNSQQENLEREKEILYRLARAGEYKDEHTGKHISRIGNFSAQIARKLGMDEEYCDVIENAAPMHDIGKIGIPDEILRKKDKLNEAETETMQSHTLIGFQILKDSPSQYLQMGAEIALAHHERYDGQGYPFGLRGEQIPLSARIVAVADVYDALVSERPYKSAWPQSSAVDYLLQHRGEHLDPDCVDAFVEVLEARPQHSEQVWQEAKHGA